MLIEKHLMKAIIFPIISLLFYFLLLNSFPWGEGGSGLVVILTVPVIFTISSVTAIICYKLKQKGKNTLFFTIISIPILLAVCYILFPSDKTPAESISEMIFVKKNYSKININDFLLKTILKIMRELYPQKRNMTT